MKKLLLITTILLLSLCSLFAWQKTYTAESAEYVSLKELARLAGTALPDLTMPSTGDQLLNALETIDQSTLKSEEYELYEELLHALTEPPVLYKLNDTGFNFNASLTPFYIYGNILESSSKSLDFIEKENKRPNLYDFCADLFVTPYFYGKINANGTKIIGMERRLFGDSLGLISVFDLKHLSQDWPDIALGSIGNKYFNLMIGRDRVSAGSGFTGNMCLSDNRGFDDFAKFTVYKNPVAYDFTALFYDGYTEDSTASDLRLRYNDYEGPRKMVFIHRFSTVLFKKVALSAYEGVVLYGSSILSDLRVLNPFMFFHNSGTYYAGNTNNFAGIEMTAAFKHGLSANLQLIFDQIQLPDESDETGKTQFGALGNIAHSTLFKGGMLTSFIEGVYTTNGMYLKELDNTKNGYDRNGNIFYFYQIDMVTGYKRYANLENDEFKFLGYPEGASILGATLGSSYKIKNYKFDVALSVLSKGPYGISVNESRIMDGEAPGGNGAKQYSAALYVSARGSFLNGGIEGKVVASGVNFRNYQHAEGVRNNQFQVSLLCKINPLELFAKRTTL